MSGVIRMPTAMPAAAMLKTWTPGWMVFTTPGLMTVMAKNPRTTDGMAARTSRIGFRVFRTRSDAYSDR